MHWANSKASILTRRLKPRIDVSGGYSGPANDSEMQSRSSPETNIHELVSRRGRRGLIPAGREQRAFSAPARDGERAGRPPRAIAAFPRTVIPPAGGAAAPRDHPTRLPKRDRRAAHSSCVPPSDARSASSFSISTLKPLRRCVVPSRSVVVRTSYFRLRTCDDHQSLNRLMSSITSNCVR
jgi:hypothetical protein